MPSLLMGKNGRYLPISLSSGMDVYKVKSQNQPVFVAQACLSPSGILRKKGISGGFLF